MIFNWNYGLSNILCPQTTFQLSHEPTIGTAFKQPNTSAKWSEETFSPQWLLTSRVGWCIKAARRRAAWKIIKADWISYSPTRKERVDDGDDFSSSIWIQIEQQQPPLPIPLALFCLYRRPAATRSPHALFQKCSFKTNKTLSWIVSGKRGHGRREEEEDCRRKGKDFVQ